MTAFVKENFSWDGMYLMYKGEFDGAKLMTDVHPDCHPSWKGMLKPAFVARFKYGYKPWKAWVNFLVKNATVEKYMELADHNNKVFSEKYGYEVCGSPVQAMEQLGYKGKV
jgi:hypothetical protein